MSALTKTSGFLEYSIGDPVFVTREMSLGSSEFQNLFNEPSRIIPAATASSIVEFSSDVYIGRILFVESDIDVNLTLKYVHFDAFINITGVALAQQTTIISGLPQPVTIAAGPHTFTYTAAGTTLSIDGGTAINISGPGPFAIPVAITGQQAIVTKTGAILPATDQTDILNVNIDLPVVPMRRTSIGTRSMVLMYTQLTSLLITNPDPVNAANTKITIVGT